MNGVKVCRFGLILRQEVATASRNPLECLPLSKTAKKPEKMRKMPQGGLGPWGPLGAPIPPRGTALRCSTSAAFYIGLSTHGRGPKGCSESHMAVSISYLRSQWLLNGPPRHLLPWARIPRVCWLGPEPQGTPNHTFLSPIGSPSNRFGRY